MCIAHSFILVLSNLLIHFSNNNSHDISAFLFKGVNEKLVDFINQTMEPADSVLPFRIY